MLCHDWIALNGGDGLECKFCSSWNWNLCKSVDSQLPQWRYGGELCLLLLPA